MTTQNLKISYKLYAHIIQSDARVVIKVLNLDFLLFQKHP